MSSDKQYGKDELEYDYQKHSNQRKEITFHEASGAERIVSADTSDLIVGMHVEAIVYDNDFILVKQKPKDKFLSHRSVNINTYEEQLDDERKILKESADTLSFAEKVLGGTYVQSLVSDERYRRVSDLIPNGFWQA